jgi:hypothetical protein
MPGPAPGEGDGVHQPGVAEEVDHLPPPALSRRPVDVQSVLDSPVNALGVGEDPAGLFERLTKIVLSGFDVGVSPDEI